MHTNMGALYVVVQKHTPHVLQPALAWLSPHTLHMPSTSQDAISCAYLSALLLPDYTERGHCRHPAAH